MSFTMDFLLATPIYSTVTNGRPRDGADENVVPMYMYIKPKNYIQMWFFKSYILSS